MAKPPVIQSATSTGLTPAEVNMLQPDNISVSIRNGKRTVEGYNWNGEKVVIQTTIMNNTPDQTSGFRSKTMTICDQLTPEERRAAARQLKNEEKLSQTEIAKRLGVSQKTISNDLREG